MIKSLLIANRGEIAVRIIRTCRKLGIRTVAVYSEPDRHALHTTLADSAVCIGPATSAASYLNAQAIIAAARRTGVDAIHPGYGFLSESDVLITLCEQAGILFVGPSREAIRVMGSKIESKALAQKIGVPVIPGYHGGDQSDAALQRAAQALGYPLMIKASAGGGGKGMREVVAARDFLQALTAAREEAQAGFGNNQILLEKLITQPRHIEVQLAGDKQGQLVHLFERECSIQRNHQKIIEEAPAAFISDSQRSALFQYALALGRAIHYDSVGTVEFILDQESGEIHFLEMNTRLQVEHPVTEQITGIDLVEWQIRSAAGQALALSQGEIIQQGWAIEARINAEDPANDFLPETGSLVIYAEPEDGGIRVDSGVQQSTVITPFYDSLLAKLIATGGNRQQAVSKLQTALHAYTLGGVGTNLMLLRDIVARDSFVNAPLTTHFLSAQFPGGWTPPDTTTPWCQLAALASVMLLERERANAQGHANPWLSLGGFRLAARAGLSAMTSIQLRDPDQSVTTVQLSGNAGRYCIHTPEGIIDAAAHWTAAQQLQIELDGTTRQLEVATATGQLVVHCDGEARSFEPTSYQQLAMQREHAASAGDHRIAATLPGRIVEIYVQPGATVNQGDILVVLDSMKLLHDLRAQVGGTVRDIFYGVGDNVESGVVLLDIDVTACEDTGDDPGM